MIKIHNFIKVLFMFCVSIFGSIIYSFIFSDFIGKCSLKLDMILNCKVNLYIDIFAILFCDFIFQVVIFLLGKKIDLFKFYYIKDKLLTTIILFISGFLFLLTYIICFIYKYHILMDNFH